MAKEQDNKTDHGKVLNKWEFPEFTKHERAKSWYIWAVLFLALLLIYAIVTVNFLFAIIIIIGAITFLLIYRREPEQVFFAVTDDGLKFEDRFFPYDELKSFFIIYQPPEVKSLYFEFKALTKPRLVIPLKDQNPVEIRKTLLEHLEEDLEQENEPFSDGLSRMFKL